MMIHPVRMSGMVIGAPQTYDQFQMMQDRIVNFIRDHSDMDAERIKELMVKRNNNEKSSWNPDTTKQLIHVCEGEEKFTTHS